VTHAGPHHTSSAAPVRRRMRTCRRSIPNVLTLLKTRPDAHFCKHQRCEMVRCMTLDALIAKHGLASLDVLQLDTEGHDYLILKTLNFEETRPLLINYERTPLGKDEAPCRAMLRTQG
jgi:FkbM family methyltransferase